MIEYRACGYHNQYKETVEYIYRRRHRRGRWCSGNIKRGKILFLETGKDA